MTTKQQPVSGGDPYSGNTAHGTHDPCHSAAQRATYSRRVRALRESGIVPGPSAQRIRIRQHPSTARTYKTEPVESQSTPCHFIWLKQGSPTSHPEDLDQVGPPVELYRSTNAARWGGSTPPRLVCTWARSIRVVASNAAHSCHLVLLH